MAKKTEPNVASVSELTRAIKYNLNNSFQSVWVGGEISGMTRPSSGHIYLTLKDSHAQLNGIIWRSDAEQLKFEITNGMEVVCRGGIDVYAQRGTYQLIIRRIQPKGIGALELAFRQLHAKLAQEGLFEEFHKKPIPRFPKHIAVVTSPTGAAIRDFLQVLTRRWRNIRVTIVPVKVQGPGASREIAAAIDLCQQIDSLDTIVITRGGGSVEDLWSFNEEPVVRAIFNSQVPVVSGVGHEIDITLADLVADVRALTPSEAAERLVPNDQEVVDLLDSAHQRLTQILINRVRNAHVQLESLASRPALTQPLERIRQSAIELDGLENQMHRAARQTIAQYDQTLKSMAARMNAINPLAVLARGYSLTTDSDGQLLVDCNSVDPGDKITTRLAHGTITSAIERIHGKTD